MNKYNNCKQKLNIYNVKYMHNNKKNKMPKK